MYFIVAEHVAVVSVKHMGLPSLAYTRPKKSTLRVRFEPYGSLTRMKVRNVLSPIVLDGCTPSETVPSPPCILDKLLQI